ncbi:roadblock/LC7 domain-containing protein [Streptomyces sp. SA15]|uniref:roadblock/LC7 domain-containing protein n=1 Tax=Streptomyces sp. SA15 TaxID=934019 RepID=UPI0015CB1C33|nr:roadblock/LC7 domain-containing protein [Streptomyces sp. SA15]
MAAESDILEELRRLRARVPQLTGALAAGADGLVLAQDTPGIDPENLAALTTTACGLAAQLADTTGQGDFRELLVRGVHGCAATYAAGPAAVVTLLAQDPVNVGRLHLEGRRAAARIAELVDAATALPAKPSDKSPTESPTKSPAKSPAKTAAKTPAPRARTPRTSRSKPPETRTPAPAPAPAPLPTTEAPTAPTVARTITES